MPLFAAAYVSTASVPFTDRDLADLLLSARHFNATCSVTGKLYAVEQDDRIVRFVQWLEGDPADVRSCLDRIESDDRHMDLQIQFFGPVPRRRFASWDMAIETIPPNGFEAAIQDLSGDPTCQDTEEENANDA